MGETVGGHTVKGLRVTITMLENGTINFNGPMDNKILCYGLLQAAMDIVRDYKPGEESQIALPPAGLLLPRG